jgi:hypothetical protein
MKLFDNGILCLTEVHQLVTNPRDLTKEEFGLLCFFINGGPKDILLCNKTFTAAIHCGIATSNGDVRRMIKGNALGVGKRKVTDFNDVLSKDEFFETGFEDVKWTTIKNGKKKNALVIIQKEDSGEDPWFGIDYEQWREDAYVKHMIQQNLKNG